MKTKEYSDAGKVELINQVCRQFYGGTETFEDEYHTGAQLAYLLWAIADEGDYEVTSDNPLSSTVKFDALLKRIFPEWHPVWAYIIYSS